MNRHQFFLNHCAGLIVQAEAGHRCLVVACHWCGTWEPWRVMTVDHVQPLGLGGSKGTSNLVAACWDCNQRRGYKNPGVRHDRIFKRLGELV